MKRYEQESEDYLNQAIVRGLDAGDVPADAQARLGETYASLRSIPQDRPACASLREAPASATDIDGADGTSGVVVGAGSGAARALSGRATKGRGARTLKRTTLIAVAAAAVALLGCTAFAASRLVQMGSGDVDFFGSGQNLPVYDSLQGGVASLNAPVGDTVEVDGVRVTLDSVSSDRSIVNVFLTMEQEGGFDLDAQSVYEGSQENEWVRLQRIAPQFQYTIDSLGQTVDEGSTSLLDAYIEDGKVKCLLRIVPKTTLPDQVDVSLQNAYTPLLSSGNGESAKKLTFNVGLDLTTVAAPRELGAQDLTFATSQGDKTLGIERFTASDLGCVMVVRNESEWSGEPVSGHPEGSSYGPPENALSPNMVKVADDQGNVLTAVNPGDGGGMTMDEPCVIEFAGLSPDAASVTFTPMLIARAAQVGDGALDDPDAIAARKALIELNAREMDVSQIGSKLETSEYGGYELTGWDVTDSTVSIALKPYGWAPNSRLELIPSEDVTFLESTWTDSETGETGTAYHSGIVYTKQDYVTGELVQMTSYYAASDEELRSLTSYGYHATFGVYQEDATAAVTASLS